MKEKFKNISKLIEPACTILITSHKDPDGDSIGSQLALAEYLEGKGKICRVINQGELPSKYRFLDPSRKIQNINSAKNAEEQKVTSDLVMVLDCTSLERIGEAVKTIPPGITMINIDHHPDNEGFGALNYIDEAASAVGEIIFQFLKSSHFALSPLAATLLYAAILTDTGRFKFSNTTPQCLKVCAELIEAGADPRYLTNQLYFNHSLSFLKLLGSVLSRPQILMEGKICVMTIKQDHLLELGVDPSELEGVVDYTLYVKGVEIGLLFTEKENRKTKVNIRSQNAFDVSRIARIFGGGGHRNAAGCTLEMSLNQAKTVIIDQIEKIHKNEPVGSFIS